jgi:competence protein ComEC
MVRAAVTAPEVTGGLFSYSAQLSRRGIVRRCRIKVATRIHPQHAGPLESLRDKLRDSVRQQLGNNERSGLVLSLVIGERHALSTHTEQAFKRTGLSHVLVLSGYQVALFFGVVWWLTKQGFAFAAKIIGALRLPISDSLRVVRAGTTLPSLLALGLTALALLVIGFEPSSTRAMIALAVVVLARLEERHTSMGNMLVLALLILSLIAPGSALEPSTQLTFAALAGIFVAHHLRVPGEGVLRTYARTSFWVTLFPLLVGALWFDMLPLAGVICNPLLAPLVALWGTLGGACAMVALLSGLDSSGFAIGVIADGLVLMRELIVVVASGLPRWAYQPGPSLTVVLLLAGILITLRGLTQLVRRGLQHWNLRVLTPLRGVTPTD